MRTKYLALRSELDERGRRRWAAVEALSIGWGGITAVAKATGMSDRTVRNGVREIKSPEPSGDRQRRPGGGRKSRDAEQPGLLQALEALVEPGSRGDPECPLRWTGKSTRTLAAGPGRRGFIVSAVTVARLLRKQGCSLQSNRKTVEGGQHPDRDAQFKFISERVGSQIKRGQPALSVDTKKKETLGNLKNPGKTYRPKGDPVKVDVHDFPDPRLGKAVPYGACDIGADEAGVSVGIGADTAEFAVGALERWWELMGLKRYGTIRRILITADSGGSNSPRTRLWLWELQRLADRTGAVFEVCHYPPGTSKWNKIEHRLFCHISRNWRGVPLETHEIVVNLIGSTTTEEGLEVHSWMDGNSYQTGRKITDEEFATIQIKRNPFHGEWNYEIHPNL